MKLIGILLIVFGVAALAMGGFSYTKREKAVDLGPVEVTTDKAGPYQRVLDELLPTALHVTEQYANNRVKPIMLG